MADLLYFPAERRINEVQIDIDAGNKPASIEAGAAALNSYLAGEAKAVEKYL